MNLPKIQISPKALKNTEIYALHKIAMQGSIVLGKVFYQDALNKHDLMDCIDYNSQVFQDQYESINYNTNLLPILQVYPHQRGVIFITPQYDYRLSEYIIKKGALEEGEVMNIAEDLMRAVYGLLSFGYFHRNLRAEHFVFHKGTWKLESLVYNEIFDAQGLKSEYLWNTQYMPPQFYQKQTYTEDELDQKTVWDFGNLIIDMILGHHVLKSQGILEKFKGSPFSFKSIKAGIGQKISKSLQDVLGRMCHYDAQKRMNLKQFISSGFFSKAVAQNYKKMKEPLQRKIYLAGSSSVSKTLQLRKSNKYELTLPNTEEISKNHQDKLIKSHSSMDEDEQNQIVQELNFKKKLQQIEIIEEEGSSLINSSVFKKSGVGKSSKTYQGKQAPTSYEEEDELQLMEFQGNIINLFKNYFDKGKILTISDGKLEKAIDLSANKSSSQELLLMTKYALHFFKCMDLCALSHTMNKNIKFTFFKVNDQQWQNFHGSKHYNTIKKIANHRKTESLKKLNEIRSEIMESANQNFKYFSANVKSFVTTLTPEQSTFQMIKKPYRQILKKSYDLVANHYTHNKSQEWATVGMYLTFCLAVDKLYIPSDFRDNFKFYFKWIDEKYFQGTYVPLERFQQYIEKADKQILVQNSVYIISKYYRV